MSLKAKVEAIIYAAEEPVTLEQISALLRDAVLADLAAAKEQAALEAASSTEEPEAIVAGSLAAEFAAASDEPFFAIKAIEQPAFTEENATAESASGPSATAESAAVESPAVESDAAPSDSAASAPESSPEAPESASGEASSSEQDTPAPDPKLAAEFAAASDEPIFASVPAPDSTSRKRQKRSDEEIAQDKAVRARIGEILSELVADYAEEDRGMEIRAVAGGFRMATKPEHHDVVRAFAKSLKPPIRLSLAALETLAVIAYKQPITAPEISEIRGVESAGVLGTLLDRKLITTAGRKQVIGRPMQYKTSKEFLLRFGLNNVNELPSMEEFSQLASDGIEITSTEPAPTLFEPTPDAPPAGEEEAAAPAATEAPTSPEPAATADEPLAGN
jgi:segregation and condensation protein B